jgi:hypothetical protein
MPYPYCVSWLRATVSGGIATLVQIKAGPAAALEITDIAVTTRGTLGAAMETVQLIRRSAAGEVTAATIVNRNTGNPSAQAPASSSGCGTGISGGTAPTEADIVDEYGFNFLGGLAWVYVPDLKVHVQASGIIALKLSNPPVSETMTSKVGFSENP